VKEKLGELLQPEYSYCSVILLNLDFWVKSNFLQPT